MKATNQICIGVHFHAQPAQFHATLESLRVNTSLPYELLLLPDGADNEATACLARLSRTAQCGTAEPRGGAACFNRLAAESKAGVLVLLESGSVVAPGWLEILIDAFAQDARNGLAGPSTNQSWNEQCIFKHVAAARLANPGGHSLADVDRVAQLVRTRFRNEVRKLEPLHSLSDFCYAVRREVVETIGAADESYGLGPCWEMDYNIRAARAGFNVVWACASYVHRIGFTPRRAEAERQLFDRSRRIYQDKFCARHLCQQSAEYNQHCRGDACRHFAPAGLIQLQIPLQGSVRPPARPPRIELETNAPLVTCIMPTRNRPEFVRQAIQYFLRQDYPSCELVILNDSDSPQPATGVDHSRIRQVLMPGGQTIGAKRNKGCEMARGRYIAHWDDDDWYAPDRLTVQMQPLLAGRADITGFSQETILDLDRWEFWKCSAALHKRMFVEDIHGGTLVFDRSIFAAGARYPHVSLAEDAAFIRQAVRRGARIEKVPAGESFVYLRHSFSSWRFACGQFLDPGGWVRTDEPMFFERDREFYVSSDRTQSLVASNHLASLPLITCIMPTARRVSLAEQAVRYFQRQDYPNRELLILDDGAVPYTPPDPPDPRIRYVRLDGKRSLGAKRNIACELAQGELIAHWDDDDWSAPWRLSFQVSALCESKTSQVCGLARLHFLDPERSRAWIYDHPPGNRPWVAGGTMCYWKTFWERNPFPDVSEGEDTRFIWADHRAGVCLLPDSSFYVATVHQRNTSPKHTGDSRWRTLPVASIRELLKEDWLFYERWGKLGLPE
jgi:glycosyltransferase involved in cell wall biosynthesis/GT2 family glycosyltransferase